MEIMIEGKSHAYSKINKFLKLVDSNFFKYPKTIEKGLLEYDIQGLHTKILRAEELEVFKEKDLLKKSVVISNEYGNLVGKINSNDPDFDGILIKMSELDYKIEKLQELINL